METKIEKNEDQRFYEESTQRYLKYRKKMDDYLEEKLGGKYWALSDRELTDEEGLEFEKLQAEMWKNLNAARSTDYYKVEIQPTIGE